MNSIKTVVVPYPNDSPLFWKRSMDIVLSSFALLALSPLFILLYCLVRFTSRGPGLFFHRRVGEGGQEFSLIKFRTMVSNAERLMAQFTPEQMAEFQADFKLKEDPRVTQLGRFLRKTSLDELPQFFNVLIGEMSLVGPRPITQQELEKYGTYQDAYLSAKPGITGLWQVSGRNDISYEERVSLDVRYIQSRSLKMDARILLDTVRVMIFRLGAY